MQTLYLIRHTCPRLAPGICYGQLDIDVAETFDEEARRILLWLPPVELVLASPLLRTQRLAAYLGRERHCEVRSDARLMEKHFGSWEGKPWDDIPRSEVETWAADLMGYAPPGGEPACRLLERARSFLHGVGQLPQREIAVVAHGGSIRAMLALVADVPLAETLTWNIEYGTVIALRAT